MGKAELIAGAALGAVLAALAAAPAAAQNATSPAPAVASPPAPSAPSADIVVTARRRQESLKNVPASVANVGAAQLAQSGAKKLTDIQFAVPNVYFGNPNNQTQTAITIRGVGDYSRNIGMDTRVSVYLDGIYVGNSLAVNQQLVDVDRIEVLRGPQGTLFGRNTVAGAINIVTRKPDATPAAHFEASAGNYDLRRISGDVNVPISDNLFVKVGGALSHRGGYVENIYDHSMLGGQRTAGGRAQLRWLAAPGVKMDLALDYAKSDYDSFQKSTATVATLGPYRINENTPAYNRTRQWGVSDTLSVDVGSGTLIGIASYRRVRAYTQADEDAGPAFVASSNFVTKTNQMTGELRYESSPNRPLRYVAGVYFEHENGQSSILATSPALAPTVPGHALVVDHGRSRQTTYAAFANIEYDILPALTFELGARVSHDDKGINFTQQSNNPVLGLASFTDVDSFGHTAFTPSGSLKYKLSRTTNVYARVSRGYKSGGFNADVVADPHIRFEPETVTAAEVGVKSEFFDRRVRISADVFESWHSNYQVFQFITPPGSQSSILQLRNAAKARSRGFEVEAGAVLNHLTLNAGVGYADAVFTSFPNCSRTSNCDGQQLPGSPRWTASASAAYKTSLGPSVDSSLFVQYSYRSGTYTDVPNVASKSTQSIQLVNARLTFDLKNTPISFFTFVDNMFDVTRVQSASSLFLGIPTRFYNMPRTYGGGVSLKF